MANLRLVVTVVRRHYRCRMPLLDAIQEGTLGLIRAVEELGYTKGYKFSTYAAWWIRLGIAGRALTVRLGREPNWPRRPGSPPVGSAPSAAPVGAW